MLKQIDTQLILRQVCSYFQNIDSFQYSYIHIANGVGPRTLNTLSLLLLLLHSGEILEI